MQFVFWKLGFRMVGSDRGSLGYFEVAIFEQDDQTVVHFQGLRNTFNGFLKNLGQI